MHTGLIGCFSRLSKWIHDSDDGRDVEATYAYQTGRDAYYRKDDFNPYKEGTLSYADWKLGYDSTEGWEMQIW
jgi:hypothetical protein